MTLSEKIYYYRKKLGKSQEELAEALGVSRQAVSKWETGESEPELAKLRALAAAFGITVDALLSEDAPLEDTAEEEHTSDKEKTSNRTWVDALPGVLGRLVSRYGWLGGVYLAVVGGIVTLMGVAIFLIAGGMATSINTQMGMMPGGMPAGDASNLSGMFTPVYVMGGLFCVVGLGLTVTGILLAVKLKKRGE